jgi:hypothetical protein
MAQEGFNLRAGKHHWHIPVALGANDAIELAEFAAEDVSVEEQQRVKRLVLSRGGDALPHRQV